MVDKECMVESNLGLVHACANRFRNRGVDYDDLYQAGCVGLLKAVKGFNSELGFEFSTYAVPAILGEIKRIFRDGGAIKVSRSIKEQARLVFLKKEELSNEVGREPTVSELAEFLGMPVPEVCELLLTGQPILSLSPTENEDEKIIEIPFENQTQIDDKITLNDCLNQLTQNDRRIIDLRYFKAQTQSDVAKILGMTQVQVSRREKVILGNLRQKLY